ncbi:MAG TPA: c-type cytochrome [Gammaproteobacteria bacterium]|nr:c-type cytochrome [Gammaproteobacteria bacterium]
MKTALIVMFAVVAATAQTATATTPPSKLAICTACHGPQLAGGQGMYPRLAGQPEQYLYQQLQNFHNGSRNNQLMTPVARGLGDADMRQLAAYLSTLQSPYAKQTAATPVAAELERGRTLATAGNWSHGVPACVSCHAPDLGGVAPSIPALAGQPVQYLTGALQRLQSTADASLAAQTMHNIARALTPDDIKAVAAYIGSLKQGEQVATVRPAFNNAYHPAAQSPDNFTPPPLDAIPSGPDGEAVWQGLQLLEHTSALAKGYVGNDLNCVNCHVNQGRQMDSAPMWAAYVTYPKYRSKNRKVNTIEERIQGCFRFSMNGKPPAADSAEMKSLVTYFHWLATGLPVGITPKGAGYPKLASAPRSPSIERGRHVFASNCAMCHGDDGQGRSARGAQVFPPLWGARSFNWGAGMTRISTAAAFIHANMPYGGGRKLSLQEAWDVAAFVDSRPRPQDPRFNGNVEQTRRKYHATDSYYGKVVDGKLLGGSDSQGHH